MARQEDRPLNRHEIDRIARIKGQRQQYEAQRNLSPSNERAVSSARFVQDHSSNDGISRIQDGRLVPARTHQKAKPPKKAPPKKAPPKDPEFKNLNTISAQPMTEKQFYKHYK